MRIGFDARWYNNSGVGNYVVELLKALSGLAGDFEILAYEDPSNPLPRVSSHKIVKVPVLATKYSAEEQLELARRCRVDRLDVFHSPFYIVPLFAPCPVVVTIHDLIPFLFKVYSLPKQMMIRLGYRLAGWKAAHVIADSNNTAHDVIRILGVPGQRISVVHFGASEHFRPEGEPGEKEYLSARYGVRQPYVLLLGAKNWRTKNLSTALEALALCRRESELGFQTAVAGLSDGLQAVPQSNCAGDNEVVTTGFVPSQDLARLYRCARLFLFPSQYEGFGLPLLEAMSCGCPVVCSNAGSLTEVAGDGAVTVEPEDAANMAYAVASLLRDERARHALRLRALDRAAMFSWENAARETLSVYSAAAQSELACRAPAVAALTSDTVPVANGRLETEAKTRNPTLS